MLPGATVTVVSLETGNTRSAVTDSGGRYFVAALPPGSYRVTAELAGFTPQKREGVVLRLGQSADVGLHAAGRQPGGGDHGRGERHRRRREHGRGARWSDRQQIENLPINGRNFISFSVITPGVTTDNTPQQGASATSGLSFTGQRARSNNIMVDGLDNNDPDRGLACAPSSARRRSASSRC